MKQIDEGSRKRDVKATVKSLPMMVKKVEKTKSGVLESLFAKDDERGFVGDFMTRCAKIGLQ